MPVDFKRVTELYGETHEITKGKGTKVRIDKLPDGVEVCMGDGKTYHWVLTKKKGV